MLYIEGKTAFRVTIKGRVLVLPFDFPDRENALDEEHILGSIYENTHVGLYLRDQNQSLNWELRVC